MKTLHKRPISRRAAYMSFPAGARRSEALTLTGPRPIVRAAKARRSPSHPARPKDRHKPPSRTFRRVRFALAFRTLAAGFVRLERAQEVDEVLAFRNLQPVEMVNDLIGLAILALVGFDSLH
jgi:hypothetical protein